MLRPARSARSATRASVASALGQLEQPSDVNSSTTAMPGYWELRGLGIAVGCASAPAAAGGSLRGIVAWLTGESLTREQLRPRHCRSARAAAKRSDGSWLEEEMPVVCRARILVTAEVHPASG